MRAHYYFYDKNDHDQVMKSLVEKRPMIMSEVKVTKTASSNNGIGCLEVLLEAVNIPSIPAEPSINDEFWGAVRRALHERENKVEVMKMLMNKGWIHP